MDTAACMFDSSMVHSCPSLPARCCIWSDSGAKSLLRLVTGLYSTGQCETTRYEKVTRIVEKVCVGGGRRGFCEAATKKTAGRQQERAVHEGRATQADGDRKGEGRGVGNEGLESCNELLRKEISRRDGQEERRVRADVDAAAQSGESENSEKEWRMRIPGSAMVAREVGQERGEGRG